jgi:hypothetical protein
MVSLRLGVLAVLLATSTLACGSKGGEGTSPPVDAGEDVDPQDFATITSSCAYNCATLSACSETTTPYACQNTGDWQSIPHAATCAAWDGGYPAPVQGQCTATTPGGEAVRYASIEPDDAGTIILPDGRHMAPAGSDWVFDEDDLEGGVTTYLGAVAGKLVVTVDDGPVDHAVRVIDATQIGSGSTPVTGYVPFRNPETLNSAAAFVPPGTLYVATDDGVIQALTVDTTSGALTRVDAQSITLPAGVDESGNAASWYVAGLAASPDGTRLVVTSVFDKTLLVYDVSPTSPTFRQLLGQTSLGDSETFQVSFDPNDPTGQYAYVSMWENQKVLAVDVSTPSAPTVAHTYATDADPEGLAFLDARWMVVASDLGDTLSMVDRTAGTVTSIPIDATQPLHGTEPSTLAYDPASKHLYATWSGRNAVAAYDVDLTQAPPTVTPAGMVPTGWWPSGVLVESDGSLVVSEMRGHGTGPRPLYFAIGNSDIDHRMRGGIQRVPAPSTSDLAAGAQVVAAANLPAAFAGEPTVSCPAGANDFPVPSTNTAGASTLIQHVFFIVRENKGFDALFADLPGVNGDPSYLLKTSTSDMDNIWHNMRSLARTFSISDNYYTDAIYSTQGHVWATYGRTNDFNERTWAVSGSGRNARLIPGGGVITVGKPEEGSLFDWLIANQIPYNLLGEIVGSPETDTQVPPAVDGKYPGGPIQNIGYNDLDKACYTAGRERVLCDLGSFTYMTLPNDHTFGVSSTNPTPETFCAVNDEATGMMVDAITHSPLWASTLVVITEDDPSQGGEHVDSHRAPIVLISPWVKRAYVSHTHIDVASLHKLFAHLFGKPYHNALIASAAVPFDLFTSTPDYTPYTYTPRAWPLACGTTGSRKEQRLTESWRFDEPDEQPGLDSQVTRWMRGIQQ